MKIIRKHAEFVGYLKHNGVKFEEWQCPNKKCGMGVSKDYACCPYCGQKIKFRKPEPVKMIQISISINEGGD